MKRLAVLLTITLLCFVNTIVNAKSENCFFSLNSWHHDGMQEFLCHYDEKNQKMYYCTNESILLCDISSIFEYRNGQKILLFSIFNYISDFIIDNNTIYCVVHHVNSLSTDGELVAYDMATGKYEVLLNRAYSVGALCKLQDKELYLATATAVAKFNVETHEFKELFKKSYSLDSVATEQGITACSDSDWFFIDYNTLDIKYLKQSSNFSLSCRVMAINEKQYIAVEPADSTCLIVYDAHSKYIENVVSACLTKDYAFLYMSQPQNTVRIYRMNDMIEMIDEIKTDCNSSIYYLHGNVVMMDRHKNISVLKAI